ncbi:MAG: DUF11 domain-containing protein [Planctomycetes bacterium]|nr:DUF11 domain-containing protein [Planctomycetota bacterium]
MRFKLVLLLGLLASGGAAAALVRAQDDQLRGSTFGSGLRSRPTPGAPMDAGASQLRTSGRGGLAERLQQIRQSVVEEHDTGAAAPGLLSPDPEGAGAGATAAAPTAAALPSVLKRSTQSSDAPAVRSAMNPQASPTRGSSTTPAGARPLGSLPPGARPLSSPPSSSLRDAQETTPSAEETDEDASTSRRQTGDAPLARQASLPSDPQPFRAAATSKELIVVGAGPQLRLETIGPKSIVVGRPTPFTMMISNTGDAAARQVQVQVESGQNVELAVGQATHGGAELRRSPAGAPALLWSISELPRGAKAELTVNAIPRDTRPFDLAATWSCAPQSAAAQIAVLEPQLAMTLAGPKDIMFGETKLYTITLTNPGTGDAENVLLSLAPLSSGQEAPPARNIGSLRAGERKEIPIQLTAREAGLLSIRAEANADGGLQAEAVEQVMVRRGQIEIAVEGPPLKYAGAPAEFNVRVANVGNAATEELAVGVTLPSGVEYQPGADGGTSQSGGVAWRIGSLAPGDERTFAFTCMMKDEGDKRLQFQARASGGLEASAAALTRVEALADLKLVVNDPPGPIAVGKEVTYEVRVVNRGTKAAAGVEISAFFSEGIEPTGAEGLPAETGAGQVSAAPIPSLEPGGEAVLKIRAKADQAGNHIFRAVVQCNAPETRLAAEETTRFFGGAATPAKSPAPAVSEQPSTFQPYQR